VLQFAFIFLIAFLALFVLERVVLWLTRRRLHRSFPLPLSFVAMYQPLQRGFEGRLG
jgi:predicted PurR-regulated permease PerM